MWKANLNRHFAKLVPALKISIFLILWSALFHSFTLAILLFWSLTSSRVSSLNRMTTLNQFLSENQILFATLSSLSALVFFRDPLLEIWKNRRQGLPQLLGASLRGLSLGALLMIALTLNQDYEFLGLSSQLNLNFLAGYAWIFRSALLLVFVFSTEFLVRVVIRQELAGMKLRRTLETLTLVAIYWIWFSPRPMEILTLLLLFLSLDTFWSATGFLGSLFILIHAILGLNFFENETVGLLQLKALRTEEGVFQNPHLQILLAILLILIRYGKVRIRKESRAP
jgi:hypothetical protein